MFELIDSVNRPSDWAPRGYIEAALSGHCEIHAEWLGRKAELSALGAIRLCDQRGFIRRGNVWWLALAAHARRGSCKGWGREARPSRRTWRVHSRSQEAIDAIRELIHYDFIRAIWPAGAPRMARNCARFDRGSWQL